MSPGVSVVIPAYRAARYLGETLDSVRAQTEPVAAIIVVDDGSDDGTGDVAEAWSRSTGVRVEVIRQANAGAGAARRVGLAVVMTDLVALLDADDRWLPDAVARLRAALDAHPDALLVYGAMRPFADESLPEAEGVRRATLARGASYCFSSSLLRRHAFDVVGGFSDHTFSSVDWFARLIEAGPAASVALDEVVAERRVHSANSSFLESRPTLQYAQAIKASLDRRRARGDVGP